MKDMLATLRKAKQKKVFKNQKEFEDVLAKIQLADTELRIDWDDGAGEEWARFNNLKVNGVLFHFLNAVLSEKITFL